MTKDFKDFNATVLPHLRVLRRRAGTLTTNPTDAADLLQDTLERALRSWATLRPDSNVVAWVMTIMQRRAIDLSRQRRLWQRAVPTEVHDLPTPPAYLPVPWENIGIPQIQRAMSRLPERLRITFALRVVDRLPCRDIAHRLSIALCTVHTRLLRARLKLRKLLQQPHSLREAPRARPRAGTRRADAGTKATSPAATSTSITVLALTRNAAGA